MYPDPRGTKYFPGGRYELRRVKSFLPSFLHPLGIARAAVSLSSLRERALKGQSFPLKLWRGIKWLALSSRGLTDTALAGGVSDRIDKVTLMHSYRYGVFFINVINNDLTACTVEFLDDR